MSWQASAWAANIPHNVVGYVAFRTLMLLANNANEDGTAVWLEASTVATRLGVAQRTVERGLKELRDQNLIKLGDQRHVEHIRADRRPKVWDLTMASMLVLQEGQNVGTTDLSGRHPVTDRSEVHGPTTGVVLEHGRTTHRSIDSSQRNSREHVGPFDQARCNWNRWTYSADHFPPAGTTGREDWTCIRCNFVVKGLKTLSEIRAELETEQ